MRWILSNCNLCHPGNTVLSLLIISGITMGLLDTNQYISTYIDYYIYKNYTYRLPYLNLLLYTLITKYIYIYTISYLYRTIPMDFYTYTHIYIYIHTHTYIYIYEIWLVTWSPMAKRHPFPPSAPHRVRRQQQGQGLGAGHAEVVGGQVQAELARSERSTWGWDVWLEKSWLYKQICICININIYIYNAYLFLYISIEYVYL